jgi:hypothetical protein
MSFQFGKSLGATQFEGYVLAAFGMSLDIAKVFGLAFTAYAWEKERYGKAICGFLVWAICVAYSACAAFGFATMSRDSVVAARAAVSDQQIADRAERTRLNEQLEKARAHPMFAESYGCTDARYKKAKEWCATYWEAAVRLDRVTAKVHSATVTTPDPQAAIMARIFDTTPARAAIALAIFLAIACEVISALGTFVFSPSWRKSVPAASGTGNTSKPKLAYAAAN